MPSLIEARRHMNRTPDASPASREHAWPSMLAALTALLTITFVVQTGSQSLLISASGGHTEQSKDAATVFAEFPARPH